MRRFELFADNSGMMNPEYSLTRRDLAFFRGVQLLKWVDRREADKVDIWFRASKADQKRIEAMATRIWEQQTKKGRGGRCEGIRDHFRLNRHAPRSRHDRPPDAAMYYVRMGDHYAVGSGTSVKVVGKLRRERALAVRPTPGEDRRCHALGSRRGVGNADSESGTMEVVDFFGVRLSRGKRCGIRVQGTVKM